MITSKQPIRLGRASGVKSLRAFPLVACRLIELISDETAQFQEVTRVLALDAAFSSEVLRVANSALFGSRHEITTIAKALSFVGLDRLRDLVITVALRDYMGDTNNPYLQRCWRHNLASALWCELLSPYCEVDRPLAYTGGILHDIGRIALLALFPNEYPPLLDQAPARQLDHLGAERALCDVDHCQIGHHLCVTWNFPPALGDLVAHHHDPATSDAPRLRLLVHAACVAASMNGFHTVGPPREWEPGRIDELLPKKDGARSQPRYEDLMEMVALKLNHTECSLL